MAEIMLNNQTQTPNGWRFDVTVQESGDAIKYSVDVHKSYCEKLTGDAHDPGMLVTKSFKFLLAREPKESILRQFNLEDINRYFPDYEEFIKKE